MNFIGRFLMRAGIVAKNVGNGITELVAGYLSHSMGLDWMPQGLTRQASRFDIRRVNQAFNNRKPTSGIIRQLVSFLSAFTTGTGADISVENDAPREMDFVKRWKDWNRFDGTWLRTLGSTAALEGKGLIELVPEWNDRAGEVIISSKIRSFVTYDYKVCTKDGRAPTADDFDYVEVSDPSRIDGVRQIPWERCVVLQTCGFPEHVNTCQSNISASYDDIVDFVRIEEAWSSLCRKYGFGLLHISAADYAEEENCKRFLEDRPVDLDRVLVTRGQAQFMTPQAQGYMAIQARLEHAAQKIYGVIGVPVHLAGWIKLFSTKAGADETTKTMNIRTRDDRAEIEQKITETLWKASLLYNGYNPGSAIDGRLISCKCPELSLVGLADLVNVWLPLEQAGAIVMDSVRQRIPGIDPTREGEEVDRKQEEQRAQTAAQSAAIVGAVMAQGQAQPQTGAAPRSNQYVKSNNFAGAL